MSVDFMARTTNGTVSMNLANGNAGALVRRLGIGDPDEPWFGSAAPADVLAACARLTALADLADDGDPSLDAHADGGADDVALGRFVDCGRPANYFRDRAAELARIAVAAERAGVDVTWC